MKYYESPSCVLSLLCSKTFYKVSLQVRCNNMKITIEFILYNLLRTVTLKNMIFVFGGHTFHTGSCYDAIQYNKILAEHSKANRKINFRFVTHQTHPIHSLYGRTMVCLMWAFAESLPCWWLGARLQYLQCVNNGDTAVLHWAIVIISQPSYLIWQLRVSRKFSYISLNNIPDPRWHRPSYRLLLSDTFLSEQRPIDVDICNKWQNMI